MRTTTLVLFGALTIAACGGHNRADTTGDAQGGRAGDAVGGENSATGGLIAAGGNPSNGSGQGGTTALGGKSPTGGTSNDGGRTGSAAANGGRNGNGSSGAPPLGGASGIPASGGASTAHAGTTGQTTAGTGNAAGAGDASNLDGFFRSYCVALGPCCVAAALHPNVDDCVGALQAKVDGRSYDASAGAECVAWLDTATQHGTVCAPLGTWPSSCSHALESTGTKQPGEDCANDDDCAPSDEGDVKCAYGYTMNMSEFRCQVEVPGASGSTPCGGTIDGGNTFYTMFTNTDVPPQAYLCDYADGVYCSQGAECAAVSSVGGPCTDEEGCTRDAWCNLAMQVCVALTVDGGNCAANNFECVSGDYCDDGTGTCKAMLGNGAPCSNSQQCRSNQCFDSACLGDQAADPALSYLCDF